LLEAFKSKEVDEFADSIVTELREQHPPRTDRPGGAKEVAKLRKAFSKIFARIDSFARLHPLNLYTKARLANRIQWGLKDAGYRDDFVETATQEVATHVAIAAARPRARAERSGSRN
jgi:hypothetical protein